MSQGSTAQGLRRSTASTIRWISLSVQAGALTAATFGLGLRLPIEACAAVLAFGAMATLLLGVAASGRRRLQERETALALCLDIIVTALLLGLTGGVANPLAMLMLAPVGIAAAILSRFAAVAVSALGLIAASALLFVHEPLILPDGAPWEPPAGLTAASWAALTLMMVLLPLYLRRVSREAFDLSSALAATQMALEREQRLSAIGAMSAAMAHELGTPLATIKLTAAELRRDLRDRPENAEDAALISEQAERCRTILRGLAEVRAPDDAQIRTAPIITVLEEAAEPHQERRAVMIYRVNGRATGGDLPAIPQPMVRRRPEIIHGLRNLIQNAVDFSASTVWIDVETGPTGLSVSIGDDGAGFSAEILDELGEPFATTRGRGDAAGDEYVGMGLGVFIAKTLLERTGAAVSFRNSAAARTRFKGDAAEARASAQPSGAIARVSWPVEAGLVAAHTPASSIQGEAPARLDKATASKSLRPSRE
ncbi:MAG: ActS/PrrB/RegB family redox-sensitive histidine kinase [Pseudomonadota bacterium]